MAGTLLQGRYRLDDELGRGGMGAVYRAQDILLDRPVAVKILGDSDLDSEGRARLLREARAAARLNYPNIVAVYDAGEADRSPFIVMELVEGQSLHARAPQDVDSIIAITRQLCAALEHAHRDLKPENVILVDGPRN
jgi:serine/threonine-protein kinase